MSLGTVSAISDIAPNDWDALFPDYPFTQHAFLLALESTGCTTPENGWQVNHLVYTENEQIIAAMPLFRKFNSWGEYVFDWSWAEAYEQHGLAYYPKLINAIPFTPATGPRLGFIASLADEKKHTITQQFIHYCQQQAVSGCHFLFPDKPSQALLSNQPLHQRLGYQFHWFNNHYSNFDEFLSTFTSRKRKAIRRERKRVIESGLDIIVEEGDEISASRWHTFFTFYHTTYLKRSGRYGYLNEAFFQRLSKALKGKVVLISALENKEPVAMALYFRDNTTLYGRYWGCKTEIDCLHFELCYYRGIEYAIQNALTRFDPGAQGEHKIQRGFTPIFTCSYHALHDQHFNAAVKEFTEREKTHLQQYIQQARSLLPFKDDVKTVDENSLIL